MRVEVLYNQLRVATEKEGGESMKIVGYVHPDQFGAFPMNGWRLYDYLFETYTLRRCLSLRDSVVKNWCEHPETYPDEFKNFDLEFDNKRLYLWGSAKTSDPNGPITFFNPLHVPYLRYSDGKVVVEWDKNLGAPFDNRLHITALVSEESLDRVNE